MRIIASTLSDSKVSITPTSRFSQAENVQKRDNPGNCSDSKKTEANLIATKKAPTAKTEANELAKFFQTLAQATGMAQPQQPGMKAMHCSLDSQSRDKVELKTRLDGGISKL